MLRRVFHEREEVYEKGVISAGWFGILIIIKDGGEWNFEYGMQKDFPINSHGILLSRNKLLCHLQSFLFFVSRWGFYFMWAALSTRAGAPMTESGLAERERGCRMLVLADTEVLSFLL
jgi:hypothetical protein